MKTLGRRSERGKERRDEKNKKLNREHQSTFYNSLTNTPLNRKTTNRKSRKWRKQELNIRYGSEMGKKKNRNEENIGKEERSGKE